MNILDDRRVLVKYNQSKVAASLISLPAQIEQAWQEVSALKPPANYGRYQNIVFCGMGGSNLASELVRSVYRQTIKKPFILVRGDNLPAFVDKNSLVIISSYSGNTEEIINCWRQAENRHAKIFCLATGGRVLALAQKNKLPFYKIKNQYNPSGQPRYGLGSQLGAALALFRQLKLISLADKEMAGVIQFLKKFNQDLDLESPMAGNWAKNLAAKLGGSLPILVAADFLSANVHILANQINESAKNLAVSYLIPELNHHLMEGLSFPESVIKKIKILFFNCDLYSLNVIKRFAATQKVLKKQRINFIEYSLSGRNKLLASLEIVLLGSWLSFYLAVINKRDPAAIPWVNFFKKELGS